MHGLIFETSVWLLAESTRLLSRTRWLLGHLKVTDENPAALPPPRRTNALKRSRALPDRSSGFLLISFLPIGYRVSPFPVRPFTNMQLSLRHAAEIGFTQLTLCECSVSVKITFSQVKEPSEITKVNWFTLGPPPSWCRNHATVTAQVQPPSQFSDCSLKKCISST